MSDEKPIEPPDQPHKHGKSMVGFYIALGVVAALVGLGVWLAPVAQLHYHAWRYRTARDDASGSSLEFVAKHAAHHKMRSESIQQLLGKPQEVTSYHLVYLWNGQVSPVAHMLYSVPMGMRAVSGYAIRLHDGRAIMAYEQWVFIPAKP